MMYLIVALVVVSVLQTLMLGRVMLRIGAMTRLEERVSSLTHTIALLTDTTETCFNVVASQLEPGAQKAAKPRAARQKRVVGAASTGRSVPQIAAEEAVAESEVSLRLALAQPIREERAHGSMRS